MITPELYKTISDLLGEMDSIGPEALSSNELILLNIDNLSFPASYLAKAGVMKKKIDQISQKIYSNDVSLSVELRGMVVAVQKLALNGYPTIDDFLSSNGVLVSSSFASLSGKCGYPISTSNIE